MAEQWWLVVPPGVMIAVVAVALVVLGSSVRDGMTSRWRGADSSRAVRSGGTSQTIGSKLYVERESYRPDSDPAENDDPGEGSALLTVRKLAITSHDREREIPIVRYVSFSIQPGEILAMVGETGSGKTMTALAVLGLLPKGVSVTATRLSFDGRDLLSLSHEERRRIRGAGIGFVAQEPMASLDGSWRVGASLEEVIHLHAPGLGRRERKSRGRELLTLVGIRDVARVYKSYPHELSGGMAQRVAIALALAGNPRLLIADEPTTALDANVQAEILALLRELAVSTQLAVLLITHDWGAVSALADRAVVIYCGQDVESGSVNSLVTDPAHPYTVALLSSDPKLWDGSGDLAALPGSVPLPGTWPEACRFAPRCKYSSAECTEREPIGVRLSGQRSVRCVNSHLVQAGRRQGERT